MGEIVDIKPARLDENHEFVADCCRFQEGILTEKAVRKKYRLADDVWEQAGEDDVLVRAIELESVRRIRDGSAKREKSQQLVIKAPEVLSGILLDDTANARHRIDSAKTLNEFASTGAAAAAGQSDKFIIQINLGSDTLTFNKSIAPDVNDIDPNDTDTISWDMSAAIAAKKPTESGGDNTL